MNVKRRMIISRAISVTLGILTLAAGIIKDIDNVICMGTAMLAVGVINTVRLVFILKDEKKFNEIENAYNDERNVFIARKSYSFSFWVSVYAEFTACVVLSVAHREELSVIFSYLVCSKILIYLLSAMYYRKRY